MIKFQAFKAVACESGFVAVKKSEDSSVLWLRRVARETEDRICINSSTNTASAYWATIPWKITSSAEVHVSTKCDRFRSTCFVLRAYE